MNLHYFFFKNQETTSFVLQMEEGEQEDTPEEAVIRESDAKVGRIFKSLPADTVLVVCTCQGNTARMRYAQVSLSSFAMSGFL